MRPTDTERGARMASVQAMLMQRQPDLFRTWPDGFWYAIEKAADAQLRECFALREAMHG